MRPSIKRRRSRWIAMCSIVSGLAVVGVSACTNRDQPSQSRLEELDVLAAFATQGIALERKAGDMELGTVAVYLRVEETGDPPPPLSVELFPSEQEAADRARAFEETPAPGHRIVRVANAVVILSVTAPPPLIERVERAIEALQ